MSELLTLKDVADRTGWSEGRIRALVQQGAVAVVRSNGKKTGHIRFTEDQYKALLDFLTVAPKATASRKRSRRRF